MTKETKIFPGYVLKADEDTGIVEAYVSVMGIVDEDIPPDMIELGAFTKTIQERGPAGANKIRVLHQHNWNEVVGKPLSLVEHAREQLPPELIEKYPNATGGLFTVTQFILDVQRAREDFALYKAGAMDEWSIGFDTLDSDMDKDDNAVAFRRIKEVRMWEYSPVTWGANQATMTTNVKDNEVDNTQSGGPLPPGTLTGIDSGKEFFVPNLSSAEVDELKKRWLKSYEGSNYQESNLLLVEPSELDEHLQNEAEPSTTLTSSEAAQLFGDGIDADFDLVFGKVQDE